MMAGSRRLVLSAGIVLLLITIAAVELTGTTSAISDAALRAKTTVQSSFNTTREKQEHSGYRAKTPTTTFSGTYCKWEFAHYEASAYEEEWFSIIGKAQENVCETLAEVHHYDTSRRLVRRMIDLKSVDASLQWTTYDSILPAAPHPDDNLFSRMHYRRVCYDPSSNTFLPSSGRGVQLIEPLWGLLRDPFDVYCRDLGLSMSEWAGLVTQSKEAVMPQGFAPYAYDEDASEFIAFGDEEKYIWRSHGIPPWHSSLIVEQDAQVGTSFSKPRNIHLDLGSSYFQGWSSAVAINPAASGQWFYDTYHARGQPFDDFIAVELEVLNDTAAYQQVPADLIGKYNLINIGLTMDDGDKFNTIDLIKRLVRPEDFFVFKLDIDNAPIEMPIINSLLNDDPKKGGASALVDELMFEHHVNFNPMTLYWAPLNEDGTSIHLDGSLESSYHVFQDLRKKSIRAHSWP